MTSERKNITQPADWWAAFELACTEHGMTLSEWIGDCAKSQLPYDVRQALSDRQPPGNPAFKKTEIRG